MRFASRADKSALFEPSPKYCTEYSKKMANLALCRILYFNATKSVLVANVIGYSYTQENDNV